MVQLTITNTDKTTQVTNMSSVVLLDNKNKELTKELMNEKFTSIARTISGRNYYSHKVVIS